MTIAVSILTAYHGGDLPTESGPDKPLVDSVSTKNVGVYTITRSRLTTTNIMNCTDPKIIGRPYSMLGVRDD